MINLSKMNVSHSNLEDIIRKTGLSYYDWEYDIYQDCISFSSVDAARLVFSNIPDTAKNIVVYEEQSEYIIQYIDMETEEIKYINIQLN